MRNIFATNFLAVLIFLGLSGCGSDCPEDYRAIEETGYIRCGYEDPETQLMPIRCDIFGEESHCCAYGPDVNDRDCVSEAECDQIQEDTKGVSFKMECDEPTDCALLYPDAEEELDEDGNPKPWHCCSSFKQEWTFCARDCPILQADQNPNCLSTWNCPVGQVCVKNIYIPDMWYCEEPKE